MPELNGLLLVDKPVGMTSHDVVDRIRAASGMRRIGHTGTLDPNATGLLILCLGKATRLSEFLTGLDKAYEGVMRLGIQTASYDIDGEVVEERPVPELGLEAINAACARYVGEIDQLPPMVSAVKVGGERLYRLARRGETVERPVRRVVVHRFEAVAYTPPDVTVQVRCASGCYVRTLCHDVGQDLGCGAMLAALRRTEVGDRSVADAVPVDAFETVEQVRERLIPMDTALTLPTVRVNVSGRTVVTNGGMLFASHLAGEAPSGEGWVQVHSGRGHLLALGTAEPSAMGPRIRLRRVFG